MQTTNVKEVEEKNIIRFMLQHASFDLGDLMKKTIEKGGENAKDAFIAKHDPEFGHTLSEYLKKQKKYEEKISDIKKLIAETKTLHKIFSSETKFSENQDLLFQILIVCYQCSLDERETSVLHKVRIFFPNLKSCIPIKMKTFQEYNERLEKDFFKFKNSNSSFCREVVHRILEERQNISSSFGFQSYRLPIQDEITLLGQLKMMEDVFKDCVAKIHSETQNIIVDYKRNLESLVNFSKEFRQFVNNKPLLTLLTEMIQGKIELKSFESIISEFQKIHSKFQSIDQLLEDHHLKTDQFIKNLEEKKKLQESELSKLYTHMIPIKVYSIERIKRIEMKHLELPETRAENERVQKMLLDPEKFQECIRLVNSNMSELTPEENKLRDDILRVSPTLLIPCPSLDPKLLV
jgi:hypothetical protein